MKMNMCSNRHKRVHLARWEPSPGSQIDQDHPPDHPGIIIFDHTGIFFLI